MSDEGRARLEEERLPEGTSLLAALDSDRIYGIDPAGPGLKPNEKGPQFD